MDLFSSLWLGMPVWVWLGFLAVVLLILAFDLGVLHREAHEIELRESLWLSAFYIGLGLLWAGAVWWIYARYGSSEALDPRIAALPDAGSRAAEAVKLYLTGYLLEKALAMDNVFVIAMIFSYFSVPRIYQHRVLFWGILGVILLRGLMIGLGAALVLNMAWILYVFAGILLLTGIKLFRDADAPPSIRDNPVLHALKRRMRVTEALHGQRFFVRLPTSPGGLPLWHATPLFLCLVLVELADVVFAIDSVPAIFAITPDPFIVYTSNIFAILGLRALYFALAAMVHRFHYLKYALALVLVFIGLKILVGHGLLGMQVPAMLSLGVTVGLLGGGVVWSLWASRSKAET